MTGPSEQRSRRAVFLDRDGTINVEMDYLALPALCVLLPGVGEAIARLNRAGFLVIVVTNQSGVGRGFFNKDAIAAVHARLGELLAPFGAHIDAHYFCPHRPDDGCVCRKPQPGMLYQAALDHEINLARSFMVGDKLSDIEAGTAAGCRTGLVLTGYGKTNFADAWCRGVEPSFVADDLNAAATWMIAQGTT